LNPPIVAYKLPWLSVTAAPVVVVEETPAEPAAETITEEEVIPE
jgi:hypothetical protein